MNLYIQIFLLGLAILIGAMIINFIWTAIGLNTWYGFIINIGKIGILESIKKEKLNMIFLLIIYPMLLGTIAYQIKKVI